MTFIFDLAKELFLTFSQASFETFSWSWLISFWWFFNLKENKTTYLLLYVKSKKPSVKAKDLTMWTHPDKTFSHYKSSKSHWIIYRVIKTKLWSKFNDRSVMQSSWKNWVKYRMPPFSEYSFYQSWQPYLTGTFLTSSQLTYYLARLKKYHSALLNTQSKEKLVAIQHSSLGTFLRLMKISNQNRLNSLLTLAGPNFNFGGFPFKFELLSLINFNPKSNILTTLVAVKVENQKWSSFLQEYRVISVYTKKNKFTFKTKK